MAPPGTWLCTPAVSSWLLRPAHPAPPHSFPVASSPLLAFSLFLLAHSLSPLLPFLSTLSCFLDFPLTSLYCLLHSSPSLPLIQDLSASLPFPSLPLPPVCLLTVCLPSVCTFGACSVQLGPMGAPRLLYKERQTQPNPNNQDLLRTAACALRIPPSPDTPLDTEGASKARQIWKSVEVPGTVPDLEAQPSLRRWVGSW